MDFKSWLRWEGPLKWWFWEVVKGFALFQMMVYGKWRNKIKLVTIVDG